MQTSMLGLPDIVEVGPPTVDGNQYLFTARCTTAPPPCCLLPPVKNGGKRVKYLDTSMHGKQVVIFVVRQRFLCRTCGQTSYQPVPHMDETHMMTERLVGYIINGAMERPFTALAKEIGMDEATVRRVFRRWATDQLQRLKIGTPRHMGIDEFHMLSNFRGIITDVENKTVVEILTNRKKATVSKYLAAMHHKQRVEAVTIDMHHPYREAVQDQLPKAVIVVDKFHIVRMAYGALEVVRQEHRRGMSKTERLRLKDDRWLLRRNTENLSVDQLMILEQWLADYPLLNDAYRTKERFKMVWKAPTREEAEARYDEWRKTIPKTVEPAFHNLRGAMLNWQHEIFNYWDCRITNAYTEAANGVAKIINLMGRGYSFEVLRAKILLNERNQKKPETGGMAFRGRSADRMKRHLDEQPLSLGVPFWRFQKTEKLHLINPYPLPDWY